MAKKRTKQKTKQDEADLIPIDPSQPMTYQEVLFITIGLKTLSEDPAESMRYRELARVSAAWLWRLGMHLYEEQKGKDNGQEPCAGQPK